jgi:phosphoribosylformylglycinamidine cyclo-ligase
MSEGGAYAKAGVDVGIEAQASRIMYEASKRTFANRKGLIGDIVAPFDDFSGLRMIDVSKLPEGSFMSIGFDTAGTKVEIAQRVGKHDTIAFDLLAMVCDDALVRGGEPALVGTNLDLKSLGSDEKFLPIVQQLAEGYVAAANDANVAIANGEIVQMGPLVSGHGNFPYHWGAACIWFARKEKLFTGKEIQVGDAVVALRENGFRCNGLSLVRKVFEEQHGEQWHSTSFEQTTLGEATLLPSKIYSRFVVGLHGGFASAGTAEVHGVAHITGGGVREKMIRVLRPSGYGAILTDLFEPPAIMAYCQSKGRVSDVDAYGTWNMGQGLLIITPEPEKVVAEAAQAGIEARIAGTIAENPQLTLMSKGEEDPGQKLTFNVQ